MTKIISFLSLFLLAGFVKAQELNLTVTINSERSNLQNTDIFNQMKASFEQFLNGRSWTTDEFRPEERIKGNLLITINEATTVGSFSATVQVQTVRPVYGNQL
jgi:hypothetical protein